MRLTRDMSQTYASVGQAGTSRYMSPELLDRYSDIDKPEAYKQVLKYTWNVFLTNNDKMIYFLTPWLRGRTIFAPRKNECWL